MENWEKHNDFNDYEFSNYGRVKRIDTGYILKETLFNRHSMKHETDGYFITFLMNTTLKKRKRLKVHRIVAELFVLNHDPINKTSVNHIDGIKNNNHYTNLEWVSVRENNRHATVMGLNEKSKRLNVDIIRDIRKEFLETDISIADLCNKYNHSGIKNIINYNSWGWVDENQKDEYLAKITPKLINKQSVVYLHNQLSVDTISNILKDYVNGMNKLILIKKYNIKISLFNHILENETLPSIEYLPNEIFKPINDILISNMGRLIKKNKIYKKNLINNKELYIIVADLFLVKPNENYKPKLINNKLSHSINNIAWEKINIIDEDLIIEDYKTSDLTRTELCKKYSISDKKINIILKGIDWRDTPRANKVAQAKTQTTKKHECLTCGETNPDMFKFKNKSECKKCCNTKHRINYKSVKKISEKFPKKIF